MYNIHLTSLTHSFCTVKEIYYDETGGILKLHVKGFTLIREMKILKKIMKDAVSALTPILPFGFSESWDDLNPRLFHAVHIYWLKFYGMWYNGFSPKSILFWLQLLYTVIVLWLVCFLPVIGEVVYLLKRTENIGDIAEGYTYFFVYFLCSGLIIDGIYLINKLIAKVTRQKGLSIRYNYMFYN